MCATSTFAWCPGLPIHVSADLVNWRLVAHALPEIPGLDQLGVGDGRTIRGSAILNRETVLMPVRWDAGQWPVFVPGAGVVPMRTTYPPGQPCDVPGIASPWLGMRGLPPVRAVGDAWELDARPVRPEEPVGVPSLAARRLTDWTGFFAADITLTPGTVGGIALLADDLWQVRIERRDDMLHPVQDWEVTIDRIHLATLRCVPTLWAISLNGEIKSPPQFASVPDPISKPRDADERRLRMTWTWDTTRWDGLIDPLAPMPLLETC